MFNETFHLFGIILPNTPTPPPPHPFSPLSKHTSLAWSFSPVGKDNFKNHQVVEWQLQWWVVNGNGSDDNVVLGLVASLLIVGEGWWQCSKNTNMMVVASKRGGQVWLVTSNEGDGGLGRWRRVNSSKGGNWHWWRAGVGAWWVI